VFVAGASGVLGVRLVPLLVEAGHEVVGMTRSPTKVDGLAALGATPVVCDVFDRDALVAAVVDAAPDLLLHELTDLPDDRASAREIGDRNARMRTAGTDNLLAAAREAGTTRVVAQSIAWTPSGAGAAAVEHLERSVLGVEGVVLRYGQFYGPGTWYPDAPPGPPRVSLDRAATATVDALDLPSGTYLVTD
jgi:nucleoside-diphosphate-sugar epimerase